MSLTQQQEQLLDRFQIDQSVRDSLIESFIPFAKFVAKSFNCTDWDAREDVRSAAYIGLIRGIDRLTQKEVDRAAIEGFLSKWIRTQILQHFSHIYEHNALLTKVKEHRIKMTMRPRLGNLYDTTEMRKEYKIPYQYAAIFDLLAAEVPVDEISSQLNVPKRTIYRRIRDIKERIRKYYA